MGKQVFYSCFTTNKPYGSDKAIREWLFNTTIYESLKNYYVTYKSNVKNDSLEFITEYDLTSKKFDSSATVFIDILNGHSSNKRTSVRPKLQKLIQSEDIDTIHILSFYDLGDSLQEVLDVFKACNQARIGLMSYDCHENRVLPYSNTSDITGSYSDEAALASGYYFLNSIFPVEASTEVDSVFIEMQDSAFEYNGFADTYNNVILEHRYNGSMDYFVRKQFISENNAKDFANEIKLEEAKRNKASIDIMTCLSLLKIPSSKGGRKKNEVTENLISALFLYESYQISMDAAKKLSGYSLNGFTSKCHDIETHPANYLMEYRFPDGVTCTNYADIQEKWLNYYLKKICNMDSTDFWKNNLPKRMGLIPMTVEETKQYEIEKAESQAIKKQNKLNGTNIEVPKVNQANYCLQFITLLGGTSHLEKFSNTYSYQICRLSSLPPMTFIDAKRYEKKFYDVKNNIRQRIHDETYPLDSSINEYIYSKTEIPFPDWYISKFS